MLMLIDNPFFQYENIRVYLTLVLSFFSGESKGFKFQSLVYQHAGFENGWIYVVTNSIPYEYDDRKILKL